MGSGEGKKKKDKGQAAAGEGEYLLQAFLMNVHACQFYMKPQSSMKHSIE